jgi:hypothetical protein
MVWMKSTARRFFGERENYKGKEYEKSNKHPNCIPHHRIVVVRAEYFS